MQIKVTTGALERHSNTNPQIGNGSAGDGHGLPLSPYRFLLVLLFVSVLVAVCGNETV